MTKEQMKPADMGSVGPYATVDLGSNSFHLIVARFVDGALQPLVKDKRTVRLAEGLDESRNLSSQAMERALEVLKGFAATLSDLPQDSVRVVATYALRRAKNRREFLRLAHQFFPQPIEIVSGDEEARLIYQGVAHTTPFEGRRMVVDIGGGSTELVIGEAFEPIELSSLHMGCVSYTGRFFADGEISKQALRKAEIAARQRLEVIDRRFTRCGWDAVIGTSGTARAIAGFFDSPESPENANTEITLQLLNRIRKQIQKSGHVDALVEVEESRRAVFPAGLAIMTAVFKQLKISRMHLSDAALREGALYELNDRMRHIDIRQRTVDSLKSRYYVDEEQSSRVRETALGLFDQITNMIPRAQRETAQQLLIWAAQLHEIGLNINRRRIQMHSAYIIENSEMPGFSEEEQKILGYVISRYRKPFNLKALPSQDLLKPRAITTAIIVLRLAALLHIRRIDGFVPEVKLSARRRTFKLTFPDHWLSENPVVEADFDAEIKVINNIKFQLECV